MYFIGNIRALFITHFAELGTRDHVVVMSLSRCRCRNDKIWIFCNTYLPRRRQFLSLMSGMVAPVVVDINQSHTPPHLNMTASLKYNTLLSVNVILYCN